MLDQLINLDRTVTLFINGSDSLWLDGFAWAVSATVTWLPAILVLLYVIIRHGEVREIVITILAIALCVLLADQIASGLFKPLVERYRPTNDPTLMLSIDVVNGYRGGRFGFFSSHASNTFGVATYTALLERYRLLTLVMMSWALLNGWSRVYLGVHYFGDVLCGTICGLLVGSLVYVVFRRLCPLRLSSAKAQDVQTTSGFNVEDAQLLALTLILLYVYCCFRGLFFM